MTTPRTIPSWDERFLALAQHISQWSKDPSSQFGAVIVGPDKEVRSMGFNGFPRGVTEVPPEEKLNNPIICMQQAAEVERAEILARWDRPTKYQFVVHGEHNSILNAARMGTPIAGCTMYVNGHPCNECSKAIIQSGISKVVYRDPDNDYKERWAEQIKISQIMFKEAGITVIEIPRVESITY